MTDTKTVTLTVFLLARIAEDERTDMGLYHSPGCRQFGGWPGDPASAVDCDCGLSPRVLAECEAKRRIVERHQSSQDTRGVGHVVDGEWTAYCEYDAEPWPCPDIADIATVYSDHPDYRDEWSVG